MVPSGAISAGPFTVVTVVVPSPLSTVSVTVSSASSEVVPSAPTVTVTFVGTSITPSAKGSAICASPVTSYEPSPLSVRLPSASPSSWMVMIMSGWPSLSMSRLTSCSPEDPATGIMARRKP